MKYLNYLISNKKQKIAKTDSEKFFELLERKYGYFDK